MNNIQHIRLYGIYLFFVLEFKESYLLQNAGNVSNCLIWMAYWNRSNHFPGMKIKTWHNNDNAYPHFAYMTMPIIILHIWQCLYSFCIYDAVKLFQSLDGMSSSMQHIFQTRNCHLFLTMQHSLFQQRLLQIQDLVEFIKEFITSKLESFI